MDTERRVQHSNPMPTYVPIKIKRCFWYFSSDSYSISSNQCTLALNFPGGVADPLVQQIAVAAAINLFERFSTFRAVVTNFDITAQQTSFFSNSLSAIISNINNPGPTIRVISRN
jgi:hypothetical protein